MDSLHEIFRPIHEMERTRSIPLLVCDVLALGLIASMPWSTSLTWIFAGSWAVGAVATTKWSDIKDAALSPAGAPPLALWAFMAVGMIWADVSWHDRFVGLGPYHKLLFLPLLLAYFRSDDLALAAIKVFVASCTVMLVASYVWPVEWSTHAVKDIGVPVKDRIAKGILFEVCFFILVYRALDTRSLPLAVLAAAFLANILGVSPSLSAIAILGPVGIAFGYVRFGARGALTLTIVAAAVLAGAFALPSFRNRVAALSHQVSTFSPQSASTSAGERIEFWKKSVSIIADAPVIGHGTGAIRDQFARAAGPAGMAMLVTSNPHNQTAAVAIQTGLLGAAILWAMWLMHLRRFSSRGILSWFGIVIVMTNITGSMFNSHLSDFTQGWLYIVGVGIAGASTREPEEV